MHSQTAVVRGEAGNPSGPLVILGASYARGWALANVGGFAVVNRGVDGDRSLQMVERLERDLSAERPRAVILWGFINDFFRAAPDELDEAARRVPDNYRRMVEMLRQRGVEPIVATEVTIRPPDTWREKVEAAYKNGCKRFDGAIKGFGGCPMAEDNLTGNMPTENLVAYFDEVNEDIDLNRDNLREAVKVAGRVFPG